MRFPFLILTWGEFPKTKKIFIHEQDGQLVLPIFYDGRKALAFAENMEELSANRTNDIEIYSCEDRKKALDLFKVLAMSFGVNHVIVDPTKRKKKLKNITKIIEDLHSIQET